MKTIADTNLSNIHFVKDLCGKLLSSWRQWPQPLDMPESESLKRFVRPTILAAVAKAVRSAKRSEK